MSSPNEVRRAREAFLAALRRKDAAVPGQAADLAQPCNVVAEAVQSNVDPDVQSNVDPDVQSSVDPDVQSSVDPDVQCNAVQAVQCNSSPAPALGANGTSAAGMNGMTLTFNFNISGANSSAFLPQFFGQFMNPRVREMLPAPENPAKEMEPARGEVEPARVVEIVEAILIEDEPEATEPLPEATEPLSEATEPLPEEVVDLCRSPSPDFCFLQDFSDNEEAVDDPDEEDFVPRRNFRPPSPPTVPRPKRSLSLSGGTHGKRAMLSSNLNRFAHSSQSSTSGGILVDNLAQAKAALSASAGYSSTEQEARAVIASASGSGSSSTERENLSQARAAIGSTLGSASSSKQNNLAQARAAMVAMAQWRPAAASVQPRSEAAAASVQPRSEAAAASVQPRAHAAASVQPLAEAAAAPVEHQAEAVGAPAPVGAAAAPGAPNPEPQYRSGLCTVCLERDVEAMLRCKHLFCIRCLQALKARKQPCPKCRAPFRKWDRVYL